MDQLEWRLALNGNSFPAGERKAEILLPCPGGKSYARSSTSEYKVELTLISWSRTVQHRRFLALSFYRVKGSFSFGHVGMVEITHVVEFGT
jgi:hypothetical protein